MVGSKRSKSYISMENKQFNQHKVFVSTARDYSIKSYTDTQIFFTGKGNQEKY